MYMEVRSHLVQAGTSITGISKMRKAFQIVVIGISYNNHDIGLITSHNNTVLIFVLPTW